ncbi:MAG: MCP four helix bundle domain-containing protein, partial [Deltaproteobacteria bacterium]|nr:MCP four helix bundle domain-containing protein [Deltaproteobacteria bacterium]
MKLGAKIILVVAMLAAVAVICGAVGLTGLITNGNMFNHLIDDTVKKVLLVEKLYGTILAAVRAEKNANLSDNDKKSKVFAEKSRQLSAEAGKIRDNLSQIINNNTDLTRREVEQKLLQEFNNAWDALLALDKTILDLAVMKTNAQAKAIANKAIEITHSFNQALTDFADLCFEEIKSTSDDKDKILKAAESIRLAEESMAWLTRWHFNLGLHNDAEKDSDMDTIEAKMKDFQKNIDQALATLKASGKGRQYLDTASVRFEEFKKASQQFIPLSRTNSDVKSVSLTINEKPKLVDACEAILGKLRNQVTSEMEEDKTISQSRVNKSVWTLALVGGFGILLGLTLAIMIVRKTTRTINQIVEGLSNASDQVAAASNQVAAASQSLAEGSSEQAAAVEETSSSMEELASMTKQNADNANQADGLAQKAKAITVTAGDSMTRLTSSMNEISKASEETSKIIKTIDEI